MPAASINVRKDGAWKAATSAAGFVRSGGVWVPLASGAVAENKGIDTVLTSQSPFTPASLPAVIGACAINNPCVVQEVTSLRYVGILPKDPNSGNEANGNVVVNQPFYLRNGIGGAEVLGSVYCSPTLRSSAKFGAFMTPINQPATVWYELMAAASVPRWIRRLAWNGAKGTNLQYRYGTGAGTLIRASFQALSFTSWQVPANTALSFSWDTTAAGLLIQWEDAA